MRPRDSLLLSVGCESAGARRRFAAAMAGGVAAETAAAAARKRGARACARCAAVRAGDGSIRSRASPRGHRAASPTESNGAAGRRCDRMTPRRSNDTLLDLRQAGSEPRHAPKRPRTVSGMRATHDATRATPRFPCAPHATTPLHGRRNARRAGMRRQSRAARGSIEMRRRSAAPESISKHRRRTRPDHAMTLEQASPRRHPTRESPNDGAT